MKRVLKLPTIIALVLLLSASFVLAQRTFSITGTITDAVTDKPLQNANVFLEGTQIGSASDEDGKYNIMNVPQGQYELNVQYLGYFFEKREINVNGNTTMSFALRPRVIESREVVVTETRARERETPVAFSNVSREDISGKYDLQDIPMLLTDVPGIYSYSETGGSIGYTYLRIRGFDQSRIGVMLNGIPLNDPESHQVYWVDLADFGENVENIQIQRGIGNSLYGSTAIGGSINVITHNFSEKRKISFKTGYGSYNTKKASLGMSSGLIDNKYAIYGRFSKLRSDGYRDQAWADLWSYFFSAVRFDDKMTNKVNIYGGPELTHLTYEGVTRDQLDGKITGDKEIDRKANPLSDPNDVDNTFQPHYELLTEIAVNDKMHFNNALFYTSAKGYYRNIKSRRDPYEYNLTTFTTTDPTPYLEFADFHDPVGGVYELKKTDLVRRRWIDNYQWGVIPRLEIQHNKGSLTVGAELRNHTGRHWGEVIWAPVPIPNLTPDQTYYDYMVGKNSYSAFLHENYNPVPKLNIMADLQLAYHRYKFYDDKRNNIEFDISYNFITPRLGANYNLTDKFNLFGNFSIAHREPTFRSIYDAQYAYSTPLFRGNNYNDPMIKPEKMYDYETGFGYTDTKIAAKLNYYYMDFRNEIIRYGGQLDEEGQPVAGNAKSSYHTGIEASTAYRPVPELTLNVNLSHSVNKFKKHSEFVWGGSEIVYDGNKIGGFPSTIFNGAAVFEKNNFFGRIHFQYVGKQYLDNSENEAKIPELRNFPNYIDKVIDAFSLVNLRMSYKLDKVFGLEGAEVGLSIYNLLDAEYETAGYIDWTPLWIPGPKRNFFLNFSVDM
ncbi:TonB-dependent receptor [candidate division KSB1 bacterium]